MARVTVEDCVDKIQNRFELVLLASHRARTISAGAQIAVQRDNDKNPVVALREIGDNKIAPDDLKEDFIHSMQKYVEVDEPEAEAVPDRLELVARREIVLRCGNASITLTRAGKIILRGTYVLSRSSGVNKIKGGSVQIN